MHKKQLKSRVNTVKARVEVTTDRRIGNRVLERKCTAKANAADRKVLFEGLQEGVRKLA